MRPLAEAAKTSTAEAERGATDAALVEDNTATWTCVSESIEAKQGNVRPTGMAAAEVFCPHEAHGNPSVEGGGWELGLVACDSEGVVVRQV